MSALFACESSQPATPAGGGARVGGAPAASTRKDTITVGLSSEPDTLLAIAGAATQAQAVVLAALSQGLTERDAQNVYQPRLAERTPTIENGDARLVQGTLTVSYRIRDGARFSNGDPVTGDDVRFSWELAQRSDVPVVNRASAAAYARIDVTGPRAVDVVYRAGVVDPLYFSFCCTIVPRRVYGAIAPAELAASPLARAPVYAGPYTLRSWTNGRLTLDANKDFWLGPPKTEHLVFTVIADPAGLVTAARAGQIDVVTNEALGLDQLPELDRLSSDARVAPRIGAAYSWEHLDLNLRDPRDQTRPHPLLGDRRVREAIVRGLDRGALAAAADRRVTRIDSFLFAPSWAAGKSPDLAAYGYDAAAARALLDAAGWLPAADGIRAQSGRVLELRLASTSGSAARERVARLIVDQLRAIGIRVTLDLVAPARLLASRGDGQLSAGTFDLALYSWATGDDPRSLLYVCDQVPAKENGFTGQNYTGYCNREFDAAMQGANGAFARADRLPGYLAAQRRWTADLPVIPLWRGVNVDLAPPGLRGFSSPPTTTPVTFNTWEWELTSP